MNFRFPKYVPTSLRSLIPNASDLAVTLMKDMLQWDPEKRPSAAQVRLNPINLWFRMVEINIHLFLYQFRDPDCHRLEAGLK